jgi:HNH endonuclease
MSRDRFRAGKRLWSKADDAALRRIYPQLPTPTIARQFRRSVFSIYGRATVLGLHKSAEYMASPDAYRFRRGQGGGEAFRFSKGHVPANKGQRRPGWAPGRMKETQFKKGALPHTYMSVGSTRLVDGYVYRKVTDVRNVPWTVNWKPEHVLIWERVHGPLPAGHCLWFIDGDRRHVDLANLELHTRAENMRRNSIHNLPEPLAKTIQLLGALTRQVRRRTREEQDRRPAESPLRNP